MNENQLVTHLFDTPIKDVCVAPLHVIFLTKQVLNNLYSTKVMTFFASINHLAEHCYREFIKLNVSKSFITKGEIYAVCESFIELNNLEVFLIEHGSEQDAHIIHLLVNIMHELTPDIPFENNILGEKIKELKETIGYLQNEGEDPQELIKELKQIESLIISPPPPATKKIIELKNTINLSKYSNKDTSEQEKGIINVKLFIFVSKRYIL